MFFIPLLSVVSFRLNENWFLIVCGISFLLFVLVSFVEYYIFEKKQQIMNSMTEKERNEYVLNLFKKAKYLLFICFVIICTLVIYYKFFSQLFVS